MVRTLEVATTFSLGLLSGAMLLIGGAIVPYWFSLDPPTDIELEVLQILQPQLRTGALVFTDNIFTFKADNAEKRRYVADPRNGFRALVLPLKDGMEAAVYTGAPATGAMNLLARRPTSGCS